MLFAGIFIFVESAKEMKIGFLKSFEILKVEI